MNGKVLASNAKRGMTLSLDPNEPGRVLKRVVEEGPGLLSLYWEDKTRTGCPSDKVLFLVPHPRNVRFYEQAAAEWTRYLATLPKAE